MKTEKNIVKTGTKVGATIGGIIFLFFGLLPGFYFGSFGTLTLLKHLMGAPVEPTVWIRVITAAGIVLSISCIAAVSIVVGAIGGTAVGYAIKAATARSESKETTTAEAKAH